MADELAVTTEALTLDDSKADQVEVGEIVEKPVDRPAEVKKHPLEHSWTFWFDNPGGKQKQATWGSSLRAVYTFHTVEEFWWYVELCPAPSVVGFVVSATPTTFGIVESLWCITLPPPYIFLGSP